MECVYTAYDEGGKSYPFAVRVEGNITHLTLKKEILHGKKRSHHSAIR